MSIPTDSALVLEDQCSRSLVTHTTLYELIAAINAEVGVEEDDVVVACVVHLLNTQRLTYSDPSVPRRLVPARRSSLQRRNAGMTTHRASIPRNIHRGPSVRSRHPLRLRASAVVGARPRTSDIASRELLCRGPVSSSNAGETGQIHHEVKQFSVENV